MPGNGLSFAVGVGGQDQLVGRSDGIGDLAHDLAGSAIHVPVHGKVLVGLHRAVLGRQVAHVAVGREHFVAGAEILIDRLGLGDQFDNDNVHERSLRQRRPGPLGGRSILRCWYLARSAARTWWMQWGVSNTRPWVFSAENLLNRHFSARTCEYLREFPGEVTLICRRAGGGGKSDRQARSRPGLAVRGWPFAFGTRRSPPSGPIGGVSRPQLCRAGGGPSGVGSVANR